MAANSMLTDETIKRMFDSAYDDFLNLTAAYEYACADLYKAKDLVERAKLALVEHEARAFILGEIAQDGNEQRRKYLLTLWHASDAIYIEMKQTLDRCEKDAQRLERDAVTTRFRISAAKRTMEFAIACLGGTVAQ